MCPHYLHLEWDSAHLVPVIFHHLVGTCPGSNSWIRSFWKLHWQLIHCKQWNDRCCSWYSVLSWQLVTGCYLLPPLRSTHQKVLPEETEAPAVHLRGKCQMNSGSDTLPIPLSLFELVVIQLERLCALLVESLARSLYIRAKLTVKSKL